MKTRLCLFVLLLSLTATILAYAQGEKKPRTLDDYRPRTLKDLSTLLPDCVAAAVADSVASGNKDLSVIFHGDLLPTRVKVFYDGTTRPLAEGKKGIIKNWADQFAGVPEFYTVPYATEVLFTEDGQSYWLAVRKEFLPKFEEELKKGETVELFLIKLGNVRMERNDEKLEPVLLVEKYLN